MSKFAQRFCSIAGFTAMLMKDNPAMKLYEAKKKAGGFKRIKFSRHKPHYGAQAAERNFRHAKAGTHGLHMDIDGHISCNMFG